MDRPIRKQIRLQRYDYALNGAYFLTICTQNRKRLLSVIRNDGVELTALGRAAEAELLQLPQRYPVQTDQYVIMPDHIHVILFLGRALRPPVDARQPGILRKY